MKNKNHKSMNTKKQKPMTSEEMQEELENLLKGIRDFVGEGNYIFRGEAKINPKISSNLYRDYKKAMKSARFDVGTVQTHILKSVKKHIKEEDGNTIVFPFDNHGWRTSQIQEKNDEILDQLQHYGGKTNQIDFSSDYFIALFFACEAELEKDGRLIFLNTDNLSKWDTIYEPKNPRNRVIAQKSIFVRAHSGVVKAHKIMLIDKRLKEFILSYLDRYHSINVENIYNDVHGFIYRYKNYENGYTHFHLGIAHYDKKDYGKAIKCYTEALRHDNNSFVIYNYRGVARDKKGYYDQAIADFDKAIKLAAKQNSDYPEALLNRCLTYGNKKEYKRALADFNEAIEQNPHYYKIYYKRGIFYYNKGDYESAINDCTLAIEMLPDYAEAFRNRGVVKKVLKDYKGAREDLKTAFKLAEKQKKKTLATKIQKELNKLRADSDS